MTPYGIVTKRLTSEALDLSEILLNLLINKLNGNPRLGNPIKSMLNLHVGLLDYNLEIVLETLAGVSSKLKCGYLLN